jgi:hypothetical protein
MPTSITHRLRVDTYARLQRLSLAYHERHNTGELVVIPSSLRQA